MTRLASVPVARGVLSLLRDPFGFLSSLPAHGDLVRVRLGPVGAVLVCDLGLTLDVLRDDRTFDKGGPLFDRLSEVLGDGSACPKASAAGRTGPGKVDLAGLGNLS